MNPSARLILPCGATVQKRWTKTQHWANRSWSRVPRCPITTPRACQHHHRAFWSSTRSMREPNKLHNGMHLCHKVRQPHFLQFRPIRTVLVVVEQTPTIQRTAKHSMTASRRLWVKMIRLVPNFLRAHLRSPCSARRVPCGTRAARQKIVRKRWCSAMVNTFAKSAMRRSKSAYIVTFLASRSLIIHRLCVPPVLMLKLNRFLVKLPRKCMSGENPIQPNLTK
mmetsp:Transcript_2861/g.4168  ORF Transcript_2861/g.4168 Transcript_2861/m.4168 type:complete len:223 (-) Transcript_2861:169-837(-)